MGAAYILGDTNKRIVLVSSRSSDSAITEGLGDGQLVRNCDNSLRLFEPESEQASQSAPDPLGVLEI